ncbi:MAG: hypothetical protein GY788_22360 [bacterium]|nr:hypothetical protein [bacterium]
MGRQDERPNRDVGRRAIGRSLKTAVIVGGGALQRTSTAVDSAAADPARCAKSTEVVEQVTDGEIKGYGAQILAEDASQEAVNRGCSL